MKSSLLIVSAILAEIELSRLILTTGLDTEDLEIEESGERLYNRVQELRTTAQVTILPVVIIYCHISRYNIKYQNAKIKMTYQKSKIAAPTARGIGQ